MDFKFIEKCLRYDDGNTNKEKHVKFAGFEMCKQKSYNSGVFKAWYNDSNNKDLRIGACLLKRPKNSYLPVKYAKEVLSKYNVEIEYGRDILLLAYKPKTYLFSVFNPDVFSKYYSPELIRRFVENTMMGSDLINDYLTSKNTYAAWYYKLTGLYAVCLDHCKGKVEYSSLTPFFQSNDEDLRSAAVEAVRGYNLHAGEIEEGYRKSQNEQERISWMEVAKRREDVYLDLDPDRMSPRELPKIQDLYVDEDVAERWTETDRQKAASIYVGLGLGSWNDFDEILNIILSKGSGASEVLKEAAVVQGSEWECPPFRTYEPVLVYQKCVGDVIVEAEVDILSEVRGEPNKGRSRASRVKITDIIGDLLGRDLAISLEDHRTIYHIGDIVDYLDKFTPGFGDYRTTGFHFYNTLDEAKNALY